MREHSVETLEAIASKAVQHGHFPHTWGQGLMGPDKHVGKFRRHLEWDVSGSCESPRLVELFARYSVRGDGSTLVDGRKAKPMTVILHTRCRKCGWCLMKRRQLWAAKALTEYRQSNRTWFLTLTLRPEEQYKVECITRTAVADYDSLPRDKRFSALVQHGAGPEITRFIKRVRTNSGVPLRYLLVAEPHKSGLPHFHMLLHETGAPCRKAVLKPAWSAGFSKIVLAEDTRGVVYLCKYLSKESATRVRASFQYGLEKTTNTLEEHSVNEVAWEPVIPKPALALGAEGDSLSVSERSQGRGAPGGEPCYGFPTSFTAGINGLNIIRRAVSETSLSEPWASGSDALYETSPSQPGLLVAENIQSAEDDDGDWFFGG